MIHYDEAKPSTSLPAGGPQIGLTRLWEYLQKAYGGTNLGIYNDRKKRGGSTPSIHRDGRALDWNMPNMVTRMLAVEFLVANAEALQIQAIHIYETNQIWRANRGWYTQSGSRDPAWGASWADWIHVERNWQGALDERPISSIVRNANVKPQPVPTIKPIRLGVHQMTVILIQHAKHGVAELVFNDDAKSIIAIGAEPFDKNDDHVVEAYGTQSYSTTTKGFRGMAKFDADEIRAVKLDLSVGNIKLVNGWTCR